ncbi:MAG: CoA pyrophosphatase [Alphaproteobacteria bacterium]|nr:CoA pyrophosphatase [Alphaproteobacteria bacterium]
MTAGGAAELRRRLGAGLLEPEVAFNAPEFTLGFGAEEMVLAVDRHGEVFRPAAVLVPLIQHDDGITVLLTRRHADLSDHGGQISFPGGRLEEGDDGAVAAALREAEEEVGLKPQSVTVIGALETRGTISNYRVTPIVGLVAPFDPAPQVEEVAEIFEVPLPFVLDPANHRFLERGSDGRSRATYAIPYGQWFIFGFTARILIRLAQVWREGESTAPPSGM